MSWASDPVLGGQLAGPLGWLLEVAVLALRGGPLAGKHL